jgi:hypothetical protein
VAAQKKILLWKINQTRFAMKTIVCILVILGLSIPSLAQFDQDKALALQKIEKYTRMKNTGIGLTVAGSVLTIAGAVILSNVTWVEDSYGNYTSTDGNAVGGAVCILGGIGGLGAGIPLAIIGSKSKKKYEAKLQSISLRIKANPQNTGIALTYRF